MKEMVFAVKDLQITFSCHAMNEQMTSSNTTLFVHKLVVLSVVSTKTGLQAEFSLGACAMVMVSRKIESQSHVQSCRRNSFP